VCSYRDKSGQFAEDTQPTIGFNMRKITKGNVTIKVAELAPPLFLSRADNELTLSRRGADNALTSCRCGTWVGRSDSRACGSATAAE
jgi:hypothetical protein